MSTITAARADDAYADAGRQRVARRFDSARLHRMIAASKAVRSLSIGLLARLELGILGGHKEADAMRTIRSARRGRESLLSGNEAFTVYSLARSQSALGGEMAEVGVYQGVSAKLISMASGNQPLHLFRHLRRGCRRRTPTSMPACGKAITLPRSRRCRRSWPTARTSAFTPACSRTPPRPATGGASPSCTWMST